MAVDGPRPEACGEKINHLGSVMNAFAGPSSPAWIPHFGHEADTTSDDVKEITWEIEALCIGTGMSEPNPL